MLKVFGIFGILLMVVFSVPNMSKKNVASTQGDSLTMAYINYINGLLYNAEIDTCDVWSTPLKSDITSVVAYSIEGKSIEVSQKSGARISFIKPGRMYIDQVSFDKSGEKVTSGLNAVTLSGSKMVVFSKHCPKCKFSAIKDL